VMNELKADQITKRLSQTLIPVLQLCDKWARAKKFNNNNTNNI
jgi:hypothetical protein